MRTITLAVTLFLLAACGGAPVPLKPRDVRVTVPAADPAQLDFVTVEQVIGAGEDKMFCSEMAYEGENTAFTEVESLQGKFGHHVILVSTTKPMGIGKNYDCTEMTSFLPLAIPANGWPAGYGSELKKGTPIVIQMHYVNTSTEAILVRDVVRLKKMDPATVTTWVAPFALNHEGFSVKPHASGTVTFDCDVTSEQKLLLIGGHMHESGTSFKVEWGPNAGSLTKLYEVTDWKAEYRDSPPVDLYLMNQKVIPKDSVFRTTCNWFNAKDTELKYPHEMCAAFGLFAGTREPFLCRRPL